MKLWLLNHYLGGVPDPEWTPLFVFAWGPMAMPGERGRYQRAQALTAATARYLRGAR